ncbi:TetR family transcriptional regulator [Mycolicibacterium fluoranthenivorans]|jgi:AcrR family transcriptional regulator|uniref:AcrR family transcriptional regulator n=1 Tax=Mycolicibacterium fluoranthenivorans TaxID=258505 RepID=A0A1G4WAJ0_9MYCO|nr:TetR family transcriptional regulator [Mycolicibacterium fluoranthenivorans]MCV7357682.1 TetR family transcriptional regulator [Mycolicibacterium fluoranthenivorans]NIH96205.1 AcrR family transcriptional regulator [Mycolicibacterium fluoranthenivorans]QNJ90540.1 TetR family transcriptional regulator [Mycolicibacterium fluoranthenivorans]SCX19468.1 transcriptional regulator, TetR family [Mycolicibacterium fluoranthenivorans]
MGRPRVPLLSRDRIRDAALEMIDLDGLDGLSMRKLATVLGVQAASLYKHYPTKDDVLDDVASRVVGEVRTSAFDEGADWAVGLADWARSYRAALAAHPNLVPYLAGGIGQRDASLRIADVVHGGLVRAGWPPRDATLIGAATRSLVLGSTVGSFSRGFADDVQVYRDRYPHMNQAHLLRGKADEIDTASFELALTSFIDGLGARFEAIGERRRRRRMAPWAP